MPYLAGALFDACEPKPPSDSTFNDDLRRALAACWHSGDFADLLLQPPSGEAVPVHRIVLTARCTHFVEQLRGAGLSGSGGNAAGAQLGKLGPQSVHGRVSLGAYPGSAGNQSELEATFVLPTSGSITVMPNFLFSNAKLRNGRDPRNLPC